MNKCLYCYGELTDEKDFHRKCSMALFGTSKPPVIDYSDDKMHELVKILVDKSISVPGDQAKLVMSLIREISEKSTTILSVNSASAGQYLFKSQNSHIQELPENEHVSMRIAEAFGITVVPSSLIRLASGKLGFISKRIDRSESGEKTHMIDMLQITGVFEKYTSSMESVGKVINSHSSNTFLDKIFFLELALFSFIIGNNDMHLKNLSMIQSSSGWVLSPAYDLMNTTILKPQDDKELALSLQGKRRKLKRSHFEHLGKALGLNELQIQRVFKRLAKNIPKALHWLGQSFLSHKMQSAYKEVLEKRFQQLS